MRPRLITRAETEPHVAATDTLISLAKDLGSKIDSNTALTLAFGGGGALAVLLMICTAYLARTNGKEPLLPNLKQRTAIQRPVVCCTHFRFMILRQSNVKVQVAISHWLFASKRRHYLTGSISSVSCLLLELQASANEA